MKTYKALVFAFLFFTLTVQAQPPLMWQRTYGGTLDDNIGEFYNFYDAPDHCIAKTNDGGFIVAAYSASSDADVAQPNHGSDDFWIFKCSAIGYIQWQKNYGGTGVDQANSITATADGGYAIAGFSSSNNGDITGNHGGIDFVVLKINAVGTIVWEKTLGGSQDEKAYSISQTTDHGYIVAGITNSQNGDVSGSHGSNDYWVVKLDSLGTLVWQKALGGSAEDWASSVKETPDGGFIVAGYSSSSNGDVATNFGMRDYWIVKLNSAGSLVWQKSYGGSQNDVGICVINTVDGGFALGGFSESTNGDVSGVHGLSDFWLVKTDSIGTIQWKKVYGGSLGDENYDVIQNSDKGYTLVGASASSNGDVKTNHGAWDFWVVKTDSIGIITWEKSLGGSLNEWPLSVIETSTDHAILVVGSTECNDGNVLGNHGDWDIWCVKIAAGVSMEDNLADNSGINIFPNPSDAKFQISFDEFSSFKLEIFNSVGQLITTAIGKGNTYSLNLEDVSNGIYFASISTSGGKTYRKILLKE